MSSDGQCAVGRDWPGRAAVIGAGTMGTGVAQMLAWAGIPCSVADASPDIAAQAVRRAVLLAERFERDHLLPVGAAAAVGRHVTAASSVEDASERANFVIEAVSEDPVLKHAVYAEVEAGASHETVIASNTSAIPIRELSHTLNEPGRFLGTHLVNPPQWIPCVEVIPGPCTNELTIALVLSLLRRLGKQPVRVGDGAGL